MKRVIKIIINQNLNLRFQIINRLQRVKRVLKIEINVRIHKRIKNILVLKHYYIFVIIILLHYYIILIKFLKIFFINDQLSYNICEVKDLDFVSLQAIFTST